MDSKIPIQRHFIQMCYIDTHTHIYIYKNQLFLPVDSTLEVTEEQNDRKEKPSAVTLLATRNQHPVSKDLLQEQMVVGNCDRSWCWWLFRSGFEFFQFLGVADLFSEPEIASCC